MSEFGRASKPPQRCWVWPIWVRRLGAVAALVGLFSLLCWPTFAASRSAFPAGATAQAPFSLRPDSLKHPAESFDPVASYSAAVLQQMTLEEKIRSLLVLHYPGEDPAALRSFMAANGAGGFILMGDNVPADPTQLAQLTSALSPSPELPVLVAIDEEGGLVTRLPYDQFSGANVLRTQEPSATLAAFSGRAQLLSSVGVNVNFGIDADVTGDPQSFIYGRTLGNTADQAAARVAAAVAGEKSVVASTLKHFPGHGSTAGDSHMSIPTSDMTLEQWRRGDAVPFQAGIDAGAPLVMFGHLAFTAVDSAPASLSPAWHKILRDELGFQGLAITDDMGMLQHSGLAQYADPVENAIAAVAAGNDLLLYVLGANPQVDGIDPDAIVSGVAAAVRSERIPEKTIDEAALRVLMMRRALAPEAKSWRPPCLAPCRALVDAVPKT